MLDVCTRRTYEPSSLSTSIILVFAQFLPQSCARGAFPCVRSASVVPSGRTNELWIYVRVKV